MAGRAPQDDAAGTADDRGWACAYMTADPKAFHHWRPDPALEAVKPELLTTFVALLGTLAADAVRVVLVQAPEHRPDHPMIMAAQARLAAIARERGLPYLNYNMERRSAFNDERANFADWGHLGEAGARVFSATLRRDLEALGVYGER